MEALRSLVCEKINIKFAKAIYGDSLTKRDRRFLYQNSLILIFEAGKEYPNALANKSRYNNKYDARKTESIL
jgi:hypothetical protein